MNRKGRDQQRFTLPPEQRLRRGGDFDAVYAAKTFHRNGPLTVHMLPCQRAVMRLGISVPRKVGKAVVRNRIKRLLREAFRLSQHALPRGYDVVVSVRPHEPLSLNAYRNILSESITELDSIWQIRQNKRHKRGASSAPSPHAR